MLSGKCLSRLPLLEWSKKKEGEQEDKRQIFCLCLDIIGQFQKCEAMISIGNSHEYMEVRAVAIAAR